MWRSASRPCWVLGALPLSAAYRSKAVFRTVMSCSARVRRAIFTRLVTVTVSAPARTVIIIITTTNSTRVKPLHRALQSCQRFMSPLAPFA